MAGVSSAVTGQATSKQIQLLVHDSIQSSAGNSDHSSILLLILLVEAAFLACLHARAADLCAKV